MTLKEHIDTAKSFIKIRKDLMGMFCSNKPKCFKKIYKSEALRLMKVVQHIDHLRFTIGKDYLRSIDDKTFQKLGDIYYP